MGETEEHLMRPAINCRYCCPERRRPLRLACACHPPAWWGSLMIFLLCPVQSAHTVAFYSYPLMSARLSLSCRDKQSPFPACHYIYFILPKHYSLSMAMQL